MEESPQSNFEQKDKPNYGEEFRGLIKNTLLGKSLPKWKELFSDELFDADKMDPEALLDMYVDSIGNNLNIDKSR